MAADGDLFNCCRLKGPSRTLFLKQLLPLVIGRPPAVATIVPASDALISSGPQRDAIGHWAPPFDFSKGVLLHRVLYSKPLIPNGCIRLAVYNEHPAEDGLVFGVVNGAEFSWIKVRRRRD